jgi:hypothetical protein
MVAAGVAVALFEMRVLHSTRTDGVRMGAMAAAAIAIGTYLRVVAGRSSPTAQLVAAAAGATWVPYLDLTMLYLPFRDAQLYLRAGRAFLDHRPVYLEAPITTMPKDPTLLPYLYPPFTVPLFAGLSLLPNAVAIGIMEFVCLAAVVAGLRLLGVRWTFLPVLLIWPPLAVGIQVGNVACLSFLVLAAGWRFAAVLPLGGLFKAQTGVLSLWLLRERHWRPLVMGVGLVIVIVAVTLPLTGFAAYGDWFRALGFFQASLATSKSVMGVALQRYEGPTIALVLAGGAIVVALLGRRRDGLARSAIAAVVASPTVYSHGFTLFLPSLLLLDAASCWAVLGLTSWGVPGWWGALGVLAALVLGLTRARLMVAGPATPGLPGDAAPGDAAIHPLGRRLEPWPEPGDPGSEIVPEPVRRWLGRARYRLGRGDGVGRGEAVGTGDGV